MKLKRYDIFEIKEIGVENWQTDFFWPVSIQRYNMIIADIDFLFKRIQFNSSNEVQDAFWVLYSRMVIGIAQIFNNILVHGSSNMFEKGRNLPPPPSIFGKFIDIGRYIKYNFKLNGIKGLFIKNYDYVVTENASLDMIEYVRSQNKTIGFVSRSVFISPIYFRDEQKMVQAEKDVEEYIAGLVYIGKKHGIKIPLGQRSKIKQQLLIDISHIIKINKGITAILEKRPINKLLVKTMGDLFTRCLSVSVKRRKHEVIGFSHGNYIGGSNYFTTSSIMMGVINTFVAPNLNSKRLFEKSVKNHLSDFGIQVNINVLEKNNYYHNLFEMLKNDRLPQKINRVMIIEDPLTPGFQPWPFYLDFNIRKAKLIKSQTNKVLILKKHPDRLKESEGVYDDYYDEILIEPFEKVYDNADMFIFPHIGTTTFGFAILTNKPIVIFEHILDELWPEVIASLRKRCIVVPSWYNKQGQIVFDEDALINALTITPQHKDLDYINRFLLGLTK